MSRPVVSAIAAGLALCTVAFAAEPASAFPTAGASAIEAAVPAAAGGVQDVYYRRRFFHRRGFGYRRPFGYRRYGYRRGLPGHPIRRILRAL